MAKATGLLFLVLLTFHFTSAFFFDGKCGSRSPTWSPSVHVESRTDLYSNGKYIIGGQVAASGQFPWQVSLQDTGHYCGGTLLSNDWVITAAHCFARGTKELSVVVGTNTINSVSSTSQKVKVEKVFLHPNYVAFSHKNDVALVKLEEGVSINDHVAPACLPKSKDASLYKSGSIVTVSGWGKTEKEDNPDRLRFAQIPLISQKICRTCYRAYQITDNMVCAGRVGVGGLDACKGDSGGPMVREINGKVTVIGVVSWGYGCGRPRRPGVYIRTANYLTWIQKIVQNN